MSLTPPNKHDTPETLQLDILLDRLIAVAEDLSMGRYGKYDEIFELTKSGQYPPLITRLAESFGMMAVKVEAREYRLEQIIEELYNVSQFPTPKQA